jgi:hypothetical protein
VNRALGVTSTRMPSAATIKVEKPRVIRRAVAPASAAEDRTAVLAVEEVMEEGITNLKIRAIARNFGYFEMEKNDMRRRKLSFKHYRWGAVIRSAMASVILTGCIPSNSVAQKKARERSRRRKMLAAP